MKKKLALAFFQIFSVIFVYVLTSLSFVRANEIKQTIDYGFGLGEKNPYTRRQFMAQISFDPLPELNKTLTVKVRIQSKWGSKTALQYTAITPYNASIDYTELKPNWPPPIKKGDIYRGELYLHTQGDRKILLLHHARRERRRA